jgi:pyruvate kinase
LAAGVLEAVKGSVTSTGNGLKGEEEKGINLPDTPLNLPVLTAKDIEDLEFVAQHADLVSLSFVHRAEDIDRALKVAAAATAWLEADRSGSTSVEESTGSRS